MRDFPTHQLRALSGRLFRGALDKPALEVAFAPFTIPSADPEDPAPIPFESPLRADFIALPTVDLAALQGRVFDFPVNPDEGYIDGSIYFMDRHNPVDITRLAFGPMVQGQVRLTVTCTWVLTFEGTGFADADHVFSVDLSA